MTTRTDTTAAITAVGTAWTGSAGLIAPDAALMTPLLAALAAIEAELDAMTHP
jgi:hypothetical protein